LAEHFMAWIFQMYRTYEFTKHDKQNSKGVEIAPNESKLKWIKLVINIAIFIAVVVHFNGIPFEHVQDLPFLHLWIIMDSILMLLTVPYITFSKTAMIVGDITKNIFTLYQVQRGKLK